MSNVIDFETAKKRIQTNQSEELLEILDEMETWNSNAALEYQLGMGGTEEALDQHLKISRFLQANRDLLSE